MAQEERCLLCEHSDLSSTSETHERCCSDFCMCSPMQASLYMRTYTKWCLRHIIQQLYTQKNWKRISKRYSTHVSLAASFTFIWVQTTQMSISGWMITCIFTQWKGTPHQKAKKFCHTTLVSLENILLSEIRQYQNESIFYEFMYMRYLNNQTHQTRRRIAVMKEWQEGW